MNYINDFIHCNVVWTYDSEDSDWTSENICFFNKINSSNDLAYILDIIMIIVIMIFLPITFFCDDSEYCKCHKTNKIQKLLIDPPPLCEMKATNL